MYDLDANICGCGGKSFGFFFFNYQKSFERYLQKTIQTPSPAGKQNLMTKSYSATDILDHESPMVDRASV